MAQEKREVTEKQTKKKKKKTDREGQENMGVWISLFNTVIKE